MPQLDLFAFFSEIFWLLVFFGLFFYFILVRVLPNIYYVLKLRNQFKQLTHKSIDGLTQQSINLRIEELGGYTIKLYDLTMRRFNQSRDVTTSMIYHVLFVESIFSTFYSFYYILKFHYYAIIHARKTRKIELVVTHMMESSPSGDKEVEDLKAPDSSFYNEILSLFRQIWKGASKKVFVGYSGRLEEIEKSEKEEEKKGSLKLDFVSSNFILRNSTKKKGF